MCILLQINSAMPCYANHPTSSHCALPVCWLNTKTLKPRFTLGTPGVHETALGSKCCLAMWKTQACNPCPSYYIQCIPSTPQTTEKISLLIATGLRHVTMNSLLLDVLCGFMALIGLCGFLSSTGRRNPICTSMRVCVHTSAMVVSAMALLIHVNSEEQKDEKILEILLHNHFCGQLFLLEYNR